MKTDNVNISFTSPEMSFQTLGFDHVQISGITFTGINGHFTTETANEVIKKCMFHGVRLSLKKVTIATITGCNFYDHTSSNDFYNTDIQVVS